MGNERLKDLKGIFCNISLILLGYHVKGISYNNISFQETTDRLLGPAQYPVLNSENWV